MHPEQSTQTQGNALLSATIENYRSLADPVTVSLEARQHRGESAAHELQAVGRSAPFNVLPACGIFGANATGKSSMLRALAEMRHFVLGSFIDPNPHRDDLPFRPHFPDGSDSAPTTYGVKLVVEGVRWDYSFAVGAGGVERETATAYPKGRAVKLFARSGDEFFWHRSLQSTGKMLAALVREPSALILSAAVAINIAPGKGSSLSHPLMPLRHWFARNLTLCTRANRGRTNRLHGWPHERERRDTIPAGVAESLRSGYLRHPPPLHRRHGGAADCVGRVSHKRANAAQVDWTTTEGRGFDSPESRNGFRFCGAYHSLMSPLALKL